MFKQRGVTLLEILLVLSISASILVMSVRYYGSATASLQANTALQQVQLITATVDNQTAGVSYAAMNVDMVKAMLPKASLTTPWGANVTITPVSSTTYEVVLGDTPSQVCPLLQSKLVANNHYQVSSTCGSKAADFTYRYIANV